MEKARAAFLLQMQQADESIIAYNSTMRALWEKAYDENERQEGLLIRQFIAGLANSKIMTQMSLNAEARNYQETLEEAMRLEGTFEIIRMNEARRAHGGQLTAQHQMMMMSNSTRNGGRSEAVPMEIGNLTISGKTDQRGKNKSRGQGRGRGRGFNTRGRSSGGQPREQPRTQQGRGHPQQPNHFMRRDQLNVNNTTNDDGCFNCGKEGHWARDCWQPKRGSNNHGQRRPPHRGGGANRSRNRNFERPINNLEDGTTSVEAKN